ncbi:MAG: MFS transporter [Deinococcus-Thermus bacterium]|jgi:predicted MFS family arabinose efflux permease|nr:MFS transporter [Deinococcota bacterium]
MTGTTALPSVRRIHAAYYAAVFLRWFATALPMALMVLLFQARGMTLFQIGLLMGLHSAAIVVLELPTGGVADAIGRKRAALLAQSLFLASTVVFLASFSFVALAAGALLMGGARALASGALDAWFVDALLAHDVAFDLQPSLAHAGTLTILGLSLGSLVGGAIPSALGGGLPAEGTAILTPLSLPFLASFAVQLLCIAVIALFVREVRPADADDGEDAPAAGLAAVGPILRQALRAVRTNRVVALIMAATAAAGLAVSALETFWQPRFDVLLRSGGGEAPPFVFGLLMAGAFGVGVAGNLASIPLSRALGRRYGLVAAFAHLAAGAAIVLLATRTAMPGATAAFFAAYLFNAVSDSPVSTVLNAEVPSRQRSSTLSVVSLAGYLGAGAGSIGFGALAQAAGIPAVWAVAGTLLALSCLLLLAVDRRRRPAAQGAVA